MKKLIVFCLVVFLYQKWDHVDRYFNPLPDYAAAHDGKVLFYSTAWCGYCKKTRALLETHNIDYFEYDIEKSDEGNRQHKALGGRGIPVLLINGEVIKGYDPQRVLALTQ